jgi:hypothetical protein
MKKYIVVLMMIFVFQGVFPLDTKEIIVSSKNEYVTIDGRMPVFYNNDKYMKDSTNRIRIKFNTLMNMVKMESKRNLIEGSREATSKFILKNDFNKIGNNYGYNSYVVKTFYYIGGKHGMMLEEGINFKDGKEISLEDVFKDGINYRGLIEQSIEKQIVRSESDLYYSDVKVPEDGYSFCFKGDALVIIFNPYIMASYEAGVIKFEIPISEISDFMRN